MKAKIFILFNVPLNWNLSTNVVEFFQQNNVETSVCVYGVWGQSPEKCQKISECSAGMADDWEIKSLMDLSDLVVKAKTAFPEIKKVVIFADDALYHQGYDPGKICLGSKICDDGVGIEEVVAQFQTHSKGSAEKFGDLFIPLFCYDKEPENGKSIVGLMAYATSEHYPNLEKWQQSLMKLLRTNGWENAAVKNTFVREF